jgi:hypothetical protein
MMGGTSMNPWQNIGQGGLKGIGTMMAGQKLQSEIGLQGAQTQGVQLENQMKAAAVKQMLEQLTQHESAGNAKADSVANAVEGGVTSPGVTAPTVTGRGVAPIQLNPEFDPQVLTARINAEKWTNPGAANADKERLAELMKTGKSYDTRGNIVNLPGFVGSEADRAANVKGAESAAASHYDLVETQPEGGGPTQWVPKSQVLAGNVGIPVGVGAGSPPGKVSDTVAANNPVIAKQPSFYADKQKEIGTQENEMLSQMQARQLAKQRLGAIQTLMQTYQPGAFAEQKADFVAAAKSLGIKMPDTVTANPAAFQEFTKNATANVFNDVKSMGGRVLVAEIAGLTKANVNPELQPAAAAALIGQARGVIDYEDQHTKDYFAWKKQHPNSADTSDFELPWMEKNQVSDFVAKADKGIAYSGQDIPQPAQRTVGQTYMTPKGPRTWQGNGWMKP